MKRKIAIPFAAVVLLLVGVAVWYYTPIDLMDLDDKEVVEIVIFNGSSGKVTHITNKEQIQHIVDNLNDVAVKRSKLSVGYSGFGFELTIYRSDDREAEDWNHFIINSSDTVRKDPFFYSVAKGKIDYSYIENIVA